MVDEVYQLNSNDIKTLCHIHFPVAKCRQQKKILEVIIFTKILDASRYGRPSHPSAVHDLLSRTYVAVLISRRTAFTASYEHGFLEIGFPTTTEGGQHERRGCCRRDPFLTWISQRNPHSSVFCFLCMLGWYLHHL